MACFSHSWTTTSSVSGSISATRASPRSSRSMAAVTTANAASSDGTSPSARAHSSSTAAARSDCGRSDMVIHVSQLDRLTRRTAGLSLLVATIEPSLRSRPVPIPALALASRHQSVDRGRHGSMSDRLSAAGPSHIGRGGRSLLVVRSCGAVAVATLSLRPPISTTEHHACYILKYRVRCAVSEQSSEAATAPESPIVARRRPGRTRCPAEPSLGNGRHRPQPPSPID